MSSSLIRIYFEHELGKRILRVNTVQIIIAMNRKSDDQWRVPPKWWHSLKMSIGRICLNGIRWRALLRDSPLSSVFSRLCSDRIVLCPTWVSSVDRRRNSEEKRRCLGCFVNRGRTFTTRMHLRSSIQSLQHRRVHCVTLRGGNAVRPMSSVEETLTRVMSY